MKIDDTKYNRHISRSKCGTAVPECFGRIVRPRVAGYFWFDVQAFCGAALYTYTAICA